MSRWAHDQGDCNGDHTCVWCWNEIADDTNNDTEPNPQPNPIRRTQ